MHPQRRDSFFGRRKGKPLRPGQRALMETLLPRLLLDIDRPAPPHAAELFDHSPRKICLEIGFGGGEHLIEQATGESEAGFIGVEPFENGMAKALSAIDSHGLGNIRVYDRDAAPLLDWLPSASLNRIDLLYPDPWPKRRHWKRRFVSDANIDRIVRTLAPGGQFRFVSDMPGYVDWTLTHVLRRRGLVWTAERADDWRRPWSGWKQTRYEAKAVREGRTPAYLVFYRS